MRLLLSSGFGFFAGFFCWYLMRHTHQGAGDFISAIRLASDLLEKRNPYASPQQLYPLPAALFGLPFVHTSPEIAAGPSLRQRPTRPGRLPAQHPV